MGKKLTKKQALEIAESIYNNNTKDKLGLSPLCRLFRYTELEHTWNNYWKDINTDRWSFMDYYFGAYTYSEEDELLRLLTLHMFIEDVYG